MYRGIQRNYQKGPLLLREPKVGEKCVWVTCEYGLRVTVLCVVLLCNRNRGELIFLDKYSLPRIKKDFEGITLLFYVFIFLRILYGHPEKKDILENKSRTYLW